MFNLDIEEIYVVSGGFYSIYDNFYVIVNNYGISDTCFSILDELFGQNFNNQMTPEAASQIALNYGCIYDSLQYDANVLNKLYYTMPA